MIQEHLFPITYNGKEYYEKDCDEMYLTFFNDVMALNQNAGVYMSDGMWVYPDGTMEDES
jgi:hypothetical protein